jgi:hypothetical protein
MLWAINLSKIRLTGSTTKIEARNGSTGKTIDKSIARSEPPARHDRYAPMAPTSGNRINHQT